MVRDEAAASDGRNGSSDNKSKLVAGLLGLLVSALLLALTGFTLASSGILAVAALPFLVILSPVVVPAAAAVAAVVLAFGASGVLGLVGLQAFRYALGRVRAGGGGDDPAGGHQRRGDGDGTGWAVPVSRAVTEAGHVVRVQELEVGGHRVREVQVKTA